MGMRLDEAKEESGESVKWLGIQHTLSDDPDDQDGPQFYDVDIGELRKTKLVDTLHGHISTGRMRPAE